MLSSSDKLLQEQCSIFQQKRVACMFSLLSLGKKRRRKKRFSDLPVCDQHVSCEELFLGLTAQLNTKVEVFFTTETFSVTFQNLLSKDEHTNKFLFKVPSLLLEEKTQPKEFQLNKSYLSREKNSNHPGPPLE